MKSQRLIAIILCLVLFSFALARAQDMDTTISALTEDLAAKIKAKGCQKVTVIDFTDLNGGSSELGKYIADQIAVNLVMTNRDFSVLDREHLKRIMDEHNLTASGLVDPENAKKLGMFAGVDSMIFGKVVPLASSVSVLASVETTETAISVGGAKTKFKIDDAVQQLLSQPAKVEAPADADSQPKPAPKTLGSQQFSNLVVSVDKIVRTGSQELMVYFVLKNTSDKHSIGVAAYQPNGLEGNLIDRLSASIVAADGTGFSSDISGLTGIKAMRYSPERLTEIEPGKSIKVSMQFESGGFQSMKSTVTSLTVQAQFWVNQNLTANEYANFQDDPNTDPPNCKTETFSLDIPMSNE